MEVVQKPTSSKESLEFMYFVYIFVSFSMVKELSHAVIDTSISHYGHFESQPGVANLALDFSVLQNIPRVNNGLL
jgi:hypothetical protein